MIALGLALLQGVVSPLQLPGAVDTSSFATKTEVTAGDATVTAKIPTASTVVPPGVSDSGTAGTMTTIYALANHTHASKARRGRVLVPAAGTLDITFATPFTNIPVCAVTAEAALGETAIVNAQMDGQPTTTGMRIRINRSQASVVALIGLTVLSVPAQVATQAHYVCIEA